MAKPNPFDDVVAWYPDVHPNCKCYIIGGIWFIDPPGTCDNCLLAMAAWNSLNYREQQRYKQEVAMESEVIQGSKAHELLTKVKEVKKMKIEQKTLTAILVKDKDFLKTLDASWVQKEGELEAHEAPEKKGYWALCSVEDPEGDEDGDIIVISGIESDLNPAEDRYLPLLPGHSKDLETGHAPQIGRIEKLLKTTYKDMPALAMYFTFALDAQGNPIDELVKSYYDRYRLGYSNAFSVGMSTTGRTEDLPTGGTKYYKTKLYEVSCVSVPANAHAQAITREKETMEIKKEEVAPAVVDPFETMSKSISSMHSALTDHMSKSIDGMNNAITHHISKICDLHTQTHKNLGEMMEMSKALNERLDAIEAALYANPPAIPANHSAGGPSSSTKSNVLEDIRKMIEGYTK